MEKERRFKKKMERGKIRYRKDKIGRCIYLIMVEKGN